MTGTIIDSLVVTLGLEAKGFDEGQQKAQESLKVTATQADKTAAAVEDAGKRMGDSAQDTATQAQDAAGKIGAAQDGIARGSKRASEERIKEAAEDRARRKAEADLYTQAMRDNQAFDIAKRRQADAAAKKQRDDAAAQQLLLKAAKNAEHETYQAALRDNQAFDIGRKKQLDEEKKQQAEMADAKRKAEAVSAAQDKARQQKLQQETEQVTKLRNEVLGVAAAYIGLSAIKNQAVRLTHENTALGYSATNVGMDVQELATLQQMVKELNGSAADATTTMANFYRVVGNAKIGQIDPGFVQALGILGVTDFGKFANAKGTDQLRQIVAAVERDMTEHRPGLDTRQTIQPLLSQLGIPDSMLPLIFGGVGKFDADRARAGEIAQRNEAQTGNAATRTRAFADATAAVDSLATAIEDRFTPQIVGALTAITGALDALAKMENQGGDAAKIASATTLTALGVSASWIAKLAGKEAAAKLLLGLTGVGDIALGVSMAMDSSGIDEHEDEAMSRLRAGAAAAKSRPAGAPTPVGGGIPVPPPATGAPLQFGAAGGHIRGPDGQDITQGVLDALAQAKATGGTYIPPQSNTGPLPVINGLQVGAPLPRGAAPTADTGLIAEIIARATGANLTPHPDLMPNTPSHSGNLETLAGPQITAGDMASSSVVNNNAMSTSTATTTVGDVHIYPAGDGKQFANDFVRQLGLYNQANQSNAGQQ